MGGTSCDAEFDRVCDLFITHTRARARGARAHTTHPLLGSSRHGPPAFVRAGVHEQLASCRSAARTHTQPTPC